MINWIIITVKIHLMSQLPLSSKYAIQVCSYQVFKLHNFSEDELSVYNDCIQAPLLRLYGT